VIGCVILLPLMGFMTVIFAFVASILTFLLTSSVGAGIWLTTVTAYLTAFFMFLIS
jgi:hypothetical protein